MERYTWKVLRRFVLVAMVPLGVLGLVGYLAKAQDQSLPPLSTTIPPNNPLQVAILRWYPANQTTSFDVGALPIGVAFDAANIWVTNINSSNVTKLRASDGANLGTFAGVNGPAGVAFDGANIWVADYGSDTVTKLRESDGTVLGSFIVGTTPFGVAE
jgi:hypothetical protein